MAQQITNNGTTSFSGINSGKTATVLVLGVWDGATVSAQIRNGNATWHNHPAATGKTADFVADCQLGEEAGFQLITTDAGGLTDLWVMVTESRP